MDTRLPESPAGRRRPRTRTQARRAILDAAEKMLVAEGYERFSMRRVAGRSGYTAPTIYHHFGDKQGLLDTLLEERFRGLFRRLRRVPRDGDPAATVRALAREFIRFGLRSPAHYRVLMEPRPGDAPPPSAERARDLFAEPLRELIAAGRLRTTDLDEAIQCLWVLMHGVISLRTSLPDHEWSASLVDLALDAMLGGLERPASDGHRPGGST